MKAKIPTRSRREFESRERKSLKREKIHTTKGERKGMHLLHLTKKSRYLLSYDYKLFFGKGRGIVIFTGDLKKKTRNSSSCWKRVWVFCDAGEKRGSLYGIRKRPFSLVKGKRI